MVSYSFLKFADLPLFVTFSLLLDFVTDFLLLLVVLLHCSAGPSCRFLMLRQW
jgi:hypothetical protein